MNKIIITAIISLILGTVHGEDRERFLAKKSTFLNSINLPTVDLKQVTVQEALDFAWARTVELDNSTVDPHQKGVSILLRYPSGEMYPRKLPLDLEPPNNPKKLRITISATNILLADLLKEIARQTGYDIYITSVGIVFCPPDTAPFPNASSSKGDVWEKIPLSAK